MSLGHNVEQYPRTGFAGDELSSSHANDLPARNNSSVEIPYGVMVASDAGGTNGTSAAIRKIAASTDTFLGVLTNPRQRAPSRLTGVGTTGMRPNEQGQIRAAGPVLVEPETAIAVGNAVYVRFGAHSGAVGATDVQGSFRNDTDVVTAWVINTAYTVGQRRANDTGKVYACITAGTSAGSGGPTGTAADITDGTAHWQYIGICDGSTRASAVVFTRARWIVGSVDLGLLSAVRKNAILDLNLP